MLDKLDVWMVLPLTHMRNIEESVSGEKAF
jgi:hypothetical protein